MYSGSQGRTLTETGVPWIFSNQPYLSRLNNSHGFNKKFARTTQQLRQAVGGSDVTVDILFEALLEKFNLQQRLVREFAKYIQTWLMSIKRKVSEDAFSY